MLLIHGGTRVADIYMTEFDRIFRHFYFRDIANELADKGDNAKAIFLSSDDTWTDSYFKPGTQKTNRRLMFFAQPATTWFANASAPPLPAGGKKPTKTKKTTKKKATKKKR